MFPLKIKDIRRKGKGIFIHFDKITDVIYITLGMTGRYIEEETKHTHYHFETNCGTFYMEDVRNFGTIQILSEKEWKEKWNRMGLDFLNGNISFSDFYTHWKRIPGKKRLVDVLLDQSYFSGIGNYIRSESCYLAKINPFRLCQSLDKNDVRRLFHAIYKVMKEYYKEQKEEGTILYEGFYVYQRKYTDKKEKVTRTIWKGRSIWWVKDVQK
jgi:formamidopyrimidine-DNA glycosylase